MATQFQLLGNSERYTALNPARILDTRSCHGAAKTKVRAHGTAR